jgi:uncharacterized protein YjiS (DUF1127 family)
MSAMSSKLDFEMRAAELQQILTSPVELRRQLECARALRAETTAALLSAGFRALARPLRATLAAPARWRRRRATAAALMRCSDRVLADVGIAREDIPLIARGLAPNCEPAPAAEGWPSPLAALEVLAMIQRGISHGWPRRHSPALADRA